MDKLFDPEHFSLQTIELKEDATVYTIKHKIA